MIRNGGIENIICTKNDFVAHASAAE